MGVEGLRATPSRTRQRFDAKTHVVTESSSSCAKGLRVAGLSAAHQLLAQSPSGALGFSATHF